MSEPRKARIVVIGAGVTGLTTALLLARTRAYDILVAAKHMPGDYEAEYASPWAGANWLPVNSDATPEGRWERRTWPALEALARDTPAAGLHFQENRILVRDRDAGTLGQTWTGRAAPQHAFAAWTAEVAPSYRELDAASGELRDGEGVYDRGSAFTSVCVNPMVYLPWLIGQCRELGVEFRRGVFAHVADAAVLLPPPAEASEAAPPVVVVNCTGLGARTLGGVADSRVLPARGQVVVVRNSLHGLMASNSGTDAGADEACYAMERAAGGGTVLGGCYQKGNWNPVPDLNLATRIMRRAVDMCPQLTDGKGVEHLDVVRHAVGFRPVREGGVRVESEVVEREGERVRVVHSYGHGGYGYQTSYGCAEDVVKLVEQAVAKGT